MSAYLSIYPKMTHTTASDFVMLSVLLGPLKFCYITPVNQSYVMEPLNKLRTTQKSH